MAVINIDIINKLSLYISKNNLVDANKMIHLLRLGNDFYKCFYINFNEFILYDYIKSIFEIRLDICDKYTYTRKKLKFNNLNYINYNKETGKHLINKDFSIFLYVYGLYPMIHINLVRFEELSYNMNCDDIKIVKLFHYVENEDTIKIILYSKKENKFLIKISKTIDDKLLIDELNQDMDNTKYYNKISNNLLIFKDIFIYLKNINNGLNTIQ